MSKDVSISFQVSAESIKRCKNLKPNTKKTRVHSLFNQGKYYYHALQNIVVEKRKKFSFTELIKSQKYLEDWVL